MHIIREYQDLQMLEKTGKLSSGLAEHLNRKMRQLQQVVEPETMLEAFSLEQHGYIGVLEAGDTSLQAIGLPASLEQIMPEWVSRLPLEDELYYILYVMADNDCVIQVYLPKTLVAGALEAWLEEQPLEEEEEDEEEMGHAEPF